MALTKSVDEYTVKELQALAVEQGVKNAEVFTTKAQIVAAIEMNDKIVADANKPVATLTPSVDPKEEKNAELKWRNKALKMRAILEKQPKVRILVPLEGKERQGVVRWVHNSKTGRDEQQIVSGAIQPVILNGYAYYVPKGVYVEVPEQVAQVIQDKFKQTSEAGQSLRMDRIDPSTGRPVSDQLT